ncbi:hypothetical protein CEXT_132481, partial [Caerostris extrusa]
MVLVLDMALLLDMVLAFAYGGLDMAKSSHPLKDHLTS